MLQNNQFREQRTLEFWESYTSPMHHLKDNELDLVPSSETRNYILYAMAVLGALVCTILICCCVIILRSAALTNHLEPQIVPGAEQSLASLCDENCHHEKETRFSKYCLCIGCCEWVFLEIREKLEGSRNNKVGSYETVQRRNSWYSYGKNANKPTIFITSEHDSVLKKESRYSYLRDSIVPSPQLNSN